MRAGTTIGQLCRPTGSEPVNSLQYAHSPEGWQALDASMIERGQPRTGSFGPLVEIGAYRLYIDKKFAMLLEATCFLCVALPRRGHFFAAQSAKKRSFRYTGRNENFVLVARKSGGAGAILT